MSYDSKKHKDPNFICSKERRAKSDDSSLGQFVCPLSVFLANI